MKKLLMITVVATMLFSQSSLAQANTGQSQDHRVQRTLSQTKLKYTVTNQGNYRLINKINDYRKQMVIINSPTSRLGRMEVRKVWSIAYTSNRPLSSQLMKQLLDENSRMKCGGWQVTEVDGKHVVSFRAMIPANANVQTLLLTMHAVTTSADRLEQQLTGGDQF